MARIKEHFGYDLSDDVRTYTVDDRDYLVNLVKEHKILRWKNQKLTPEEYITFSEIFGTLWENDDPKLLGGNGEIDSKVPGFNKITRVSNKDKGVLSDYEVAWHSDVIHKPFFTDGGTTPFRLLYAHKLPTDTHTVTKWCDCEYAYDSLPSDLKQLSESLKMSCQAPYKTTWTGNIIPFVFTDPNTQRKSLKLEKTFFNKFLGMDELASKILMDKYFEYCLVPENMIVNTWEEGDILLTNNYNTIHERESFTSDEERTLWRTTFQIDELIPINVKL